MTWRGGSDGAVVAPAVIPPPDLGSIYRCRGNTHAVPLYACDQCGFTSAAFRPAAARAHRLENPDCEGVVRIIFRSEDRLRDLAHEERAISPPPAPAGGQEGETAGERPDRKFAVRETLDSDHAVRLTLVGDLDLTSADVLTRYLADLKAAGRRTRLDLSQLAFIDSGGIQALLVALTDARWDGWLLEVAPEVSPSVQRAAEIVGIAQVLWPQGADRTGSGHDHLPETSPPR